MKVRIYKLSIEDNDERELVLPYNLKDINIIDKYIFYGVVNVVQNTPKTSKHIFCRIKEDLDNPTVVFINSGHELYEINNLIKDNSLKVFGSLLELQSTNFFKEFSEKCIEKMHKYGWDEQYSNDDKLFSLSNAYEFTLSKILEEEPIKYNEIMMPKVSFDTVIPLIIKEDIEINNNIILTKKEVVETFKDDLIVSNFTEGETIIVIEK